MDENKEKKITSKQLMDFTTEYYINRRTIYKELRFGQAFLNKFYPEIACPEIFYEEDSKKAVSLIIDRFVDIHKETLLDILWKV